MEKETNNVLVKQNIQLRNEIANLKNQIKNLTNPAIRWVSSMSHRGIPYDAIVGGRSSKGEIFCVGRAYHQGDILPARIAYHSETTEQRKAYVHLQFLEHIKYDFEILCGNNFKWVKAKDGEVPLNSIVAGETVSGEKLYIGRTMHVLKYLTPGILQPSLGQLRYSVDGKGFYDENYEVLIELSLPHDENSDS